MNTKNKNLIFENVIVCKYFESYFKLEKYFVLTLSRYSYYF